MATLARVFHKHEVAGPGSTPARQAGVPVDTCALRALQRPSTDELPSFVLYTLDLRISDGANVGRK